MSEIIYDMLTEKKAVMRKLRRLSKIIIALFNNMRTVQFTAHHANSFSAAVNHVTDLSGNKRDISERSTGRVRGSWLADFDPFCLFLLLDDRYDDDWRQRKTYS